jgi:hypothetical protein
VLPCAHHALPAPKNIPPLLPAKYALHTGLRRSHSGYAYWICRACMQKGLLTERQGLGRRVNISEVGQVLGTILLLSRVLCAVPGLCLSGSIGRHWELGSTIL